MTTLPAEFAGLEPFADWALATEGERYGKRLSSPMEQLQAFYDAAFPRLEPALAYLDQFPLEEMPDDARALMRVMASLINVSFPDEVWRQPRVPDSGATKVEAVLEPALYRARAWGAGGNAPSACLDRFVLPIRGRAARPGQGARFGGARRVAPGLRAARHRWSRRPSLPSAYWDQLARVLPRL